ncbi:MAG: DNA integrity scanning protein DisA nucleotide-binding domain protein [Patescibacteria group bacterium]
MNLVPVFFWSLYNFIISLDIRVFLDIFIVALVLYIIMIFIKRTRLFAAIYIIPTFWLINYLADHYDFRLTQIIFQPFITFFLVVFVVVYQRDIRKFFEWFSVTRRSLGSGEKKVSSLGAASILAEAVLELSRRKFGAIIVLAGDYNIDGFIEGGQSLDGRISVPLLLSIFDPSSPGHDGAVIIENNRIKKFGVHLPLAVEFKTVENFGTRHRAGLGITEATDALALIISEERGTISCAHEGGLRRLRQLEDLEEAIKKFVSRKATEEGRMGFWQFCLYKNNRAKVFSLLVAFALWVLITINGGV